MNRKARPACRVRRPIPRIQDSVPRTRLTGSSDPGQGACVTIPQTAFFSVGEALKRTVLPAFTLIDSPVRGLSPFRAFVFLTVNVPKLGSVNLPLFFNSLTMASIKSPAARLAAAPVRSTESFRTWERNAFDMGRYPHGGTMLRRVASALPIVL